MLPKRYCLHIQKHKKHGAYLWQSTVVNSRSFPRNSNVAKCAENYQRKEHYVVFVARIKGVLYIE